MAGMPHGESRIGRGRVGELAAGADERLGQHAKPLCGQRGEQPATIREVVYRRGV